MKRSRTLIGTRTATSLILLVLTLYSIRGSSQSRSTTNVVPAKHADAINLIKDEGLRRSQVIQTLGYLTEVIGPRLTASPNMKRANEWTRDQLSAWGLGNAHLEAWGPFGR